MSEKCKCRSANKCMDMNCPHIKSHERDKCKIGNHCDILSTFQGADCVKVRSNEVMLKQKKEAHNERKEAKVSEKELKPCPFCGSKAYLDEQSDHYGKFFDLGCSNEKCQLNWFFHDVPVVEMKVKTAIAKWNNRVEEVRLRAIIERHADSDKEIARLKGIIEGLDEYLGTIHETATYHTQTPCHVCDKLKSEKREGLNICSKCDWKGVVAIINLARAKSEMNKTGEE